MARFTWRTLDGVAVRIGCEEGWRVTLLSIGAAENVLLRSSISSRGFSSPENLDQQKANSHAGQVNEHIANCRIAIGKPRLQVFATAPDDESEREDAEHLPPGTYHGVKEQHCENGEECKMQALVGSEMDSSEGRAISRKAGHKNTRQVIKGGFTPKRSRTGG
jgi:hypothetical protein